MFVFGLGVSAGGTARRGLAEPQDMASHAAGGSRLWKRSEFASKYCPDSAFGWTRMMKLGSRLLFTDCYSHLPH